VVACTHVDTSREFEAVWRDFAGVGHYAHFSFVYEVLEHCVEVPRLTHSVALRITTGTGCKPISTRDCEHARKAILMDPSDAQARTWILEFAQGSRHSRNADRRVIGAVFQIFGDHAPAFVRRRHQTPVAGLETVQIRIGRGRQREGPRVYHQLGPFLGGRTHLGDTRDSVDVSFHHVFKNLVWPRSEVQAEVCDLTTVMHHTNLFNPGFSKRCENCSPLQSHPACLVTRCCREPTKDPGRQI